MGCIGVVLAQGPWCSTNSPAFGCRELPTKPPETPAVVLLHKVCVKDYESNIRHLMYCPDDPDCNVPIACHDETLWPKSVEQALDILNSVSLDNPRLYRIDSEVPLKLEVIVTEQVIEKTITDREKRWAVE
jgi:hypothetical protein